MAQDLEASRHETTRAYSLLEEQNQRTALHSRYMETVLNNIAAGVASFDDQGNVGTVNRAACDILGLNADEVLGRRIEDFLPEPYGQMAQDVRERLRRRQDSREQHSVTLAVAGEKRRLRVNVVGFSTEDVYSGAVAVFEDISELERMQRMAAWREVARRIAHEIKNPLTPIKLSAQRLARKFGRDVRNPAFLQSTELIVRQVEYLQSMVQEFSAFAKLPEARPVPGRLEPLLQTLVDLFRNSHSQIAWRLDLPEDLPVLSMDADALHSAFLNIFVNAAEALQQAGTPRPEVRVSASLHPDLNLVRVHIADNGPGLSEEERSRLFEPYFSRKKGGTGLGMTIVRSIVTDHRGYVRAQNREGGGTIISVELPLA
jgi:two-component system nitrogen regulation sensor histidine kinase NtrY